MPQASSSDPAAPGPKPMVVAHVALPSSTVEGLSELVADLDRGEPVSRPEHHPEPARLAPAVGAGLRSLHDLIDTSRLANGTGPGRGEFVDPAELVVEHGRSSLVARCQARVESGAAVSTLLPPPYDRYPVERLLELAEDGIPAAEDLVLCHGRPTPDRCLVVDGEFAGFLDLDPVRSDDHGSTLAVVDRHLDLAVAHLGIQSVLGPEAVFSLYDGYGRDPDLVALDHYVLVAHLLGRAPVR